MTRAPSLSSRASRIVARPELWIVIAISVVLHGWRLFTPNAVIFDEVYFERFAGMYQTGAFVFDVHPPLGRLMYGVAATVFGISPARLLAGDSEPMLRLLPAIFGVAIVPLVYVLLTQLRASRKVATLAAAALLLDNALLVDTRLVLTDVFLIVFGLIAANAYVVARTRRNGARLLWLATSAFFAGCALSVKWTGASAFGLVAAAWLIEMLMTKPPARAWIREGAILLLLPAAVYLGTFALDFSRVSYDGWRSKYMSERFRRQLLGNVAYDPLAPQLSFAQKFIDTHAAIARANVEIARTASTQSSPWYTWPIMKHPIALWQSDGPPGETAMMQLLGNPIVWWGGLIGVLAGVVLFAMRRALFVDNAFGFLFLLGGVAINFLPFMAIRRSMYLYHYLNALIFVVACASLVAGASLGWMAEDTVQPWHFPSRKSATMYWGGIALMLVAFLYFAPFTYGFMQTNAAIDRRFWVLHPRL